MKLRLLAVGARSPDWVAAGFEDYARRMPRNCPLELVEIEPASRKGWATDRILAAEGERMLARIGTADHVVALAVDGRTCSTEALAGMLDNWRMQGNDVSFLIGGADGLAPGCLARARETLSLSALTFPHQLVRVMLAEQLYRAWTLLQGHPYHRG
ncbi:MAG: 23S rRNA (pseudouridine(1915)-N(3))-methyltransferase RlmH [Pseudomonadales bacterium]